MKERVVDTKYDPLIWLGTKIPRRASGVATSVFPVTSLP